MDPVPYSSIPTPTTMLSAHLPSRLLTYTPDTHFERLPTRRTPRTFPLSDLRHSFIPFPLIRPTTLLYSVSSTPDHSIVPLPVLLPSRIDASALQDEHLFRIAPQVICLIVLSAPRSHKESERPTAGHSIHAYLKRWSVRRACICYGWLVWGEPGGRRVEYNMFWALRAGWV